MNLESRINEILDRCRTPEEIQSASQIRPVDVQQFSWKEVERELFSITDAQALLKELEDLAHPRTLISLKLKGSLPQEELTTIESLNGEKFFHVKRQIDVALSGETLNYQHPLLKGMVANLTAKSALPGAEGESARRALAKLRLLVKHAGFRE